MVYFNLKNKSINYDIFIDKIKSRSNVLVTKTINMNMKFRKYPEAGSVPKEPDVSLPDIASRACSM